ncbi:alpha/beta-hydrolase [Abortiporus biennis]|nr:alpha/beta-hydrolase [Abortiporus biennis]
MAQPAVEIPFTIHIPDSEIEYLHKKLEVTRLPDELEDAKWDYGAPLSDIKRLVGLWKDGFDWRKSEESINKLPQFITDIEVDDFGTLKIHYVHQKSEVKDAIPLLFVHGWPGHFLEVRKILPLLVEAKPDQPSFHVVALSLPGFGFSEAPKKKGFGIKKHAEVANKLMLSLGYNEYVTQGGDWGHIITVLQASIYGPKHVKAWHSNFPLPRSPPSLLQNPLSYLSHLLPWDAKEKAGAARTNWFLAKGMGYNLEQSTQPQTIGYSLADSPAGLLAWIYEKLVQWSDSYPWTDEEVLEWVSIYWFSRAGPAASVRIYYEARQEGSIGQKTPWSPIPFGYSSFPKDLVVRPKSWCRTIGNVVFEKFHEDGGHFAAHERPEILAADLREMFGKGGPAFGIVPGKNGY